MDRVELALLRLIVGRGDSGVQLPLDQYNDAVLTSVENAADDEVVEGLLSLHRAGLIAITQYFVTGFLDYDSAQGEAYFYGRPFRCQRKPGARRRLQELTENDRTGVFISHIGAEAPVASGLQTLIERALGNTVPVFRSSDYKSIESGDEWYREILKGLSRSEVVVVLLSSRSVDARWINFEAGFATGQKSRVVPVVWRGFGKEKIDAPLGQLQARDLSKKRKWRYFSPRWLRSATLPSRKVTWRISCLSCAR